MIIFYATAGFLIIAFFYIISTYNKGVSLRNYVKEAFSTMDVYLKKRWDLVPNLVETVKVYMSYEKDTLEEITSLRSASYANLSEQQKISINTQLGIGLSKLIAVSENYPELKANHNFTQLMSELSAIEDDIANARKYYNGTVRELNNYTELFPSNIFAVIFNIKPERMFEISDDERKNIKVEL